MQAIKASRGGVTGAAGLAERSAEVEGVRGVGAQIALLGPWFVLAIAGIRRLVVQIKAIEPGNLPPL